MKKKIIALVLAVVILIGGIVGGTIAYLADVDSDVNVMVTGNVHIKQLEYERVKDANGNWVVSGYTNYGYTADAMQEFTQNKKAYPAVYRDGTEKWDDRNGANAHQQPWIEIDAPGSNQLFDDSVRNVVDKFVFVENTGKSEAYFRTWIAIELPEGVDTNMIHLNMNNNPRYNWGGTNGAVKAVGYDEIDGQRYVIYCATHTEALQPGDVSRPSLLQVYLDPMATNAESEAFGDTWEILAFSQAVQVEGFESADNALDTAFGNNDIDHHPWIDGIPQ